jgi:hypothetical protein
MIEVGSSAELSILVSRIKIQVRSPTFLPPSTPGIYFVFFGDGCKIGKSINIPKRIQAYTNPWCKPITGIIMVETPLSMLHDAEQFFLDHTQRYNKGVKVSEWRELLPIFVVDRLIEEFAIRYSRELKVIYEND